MPKIIFNGVEHEVELSLEPQAVGLLGQAPDRTALVEFRCDPDDWRDLEGFVTPAEIRVELGDGRVIVIDDPVFSASAGRRVCIRGRLAR